MDRRTFLQTTAVATAQFASAGAPVAAAKQLPRRKGQLKVGMKHVSLDSDLAVLSSLGVNHILGDVPSRKMDDKWSVEGLLRFKERVESYGIQMDVIALPLSATPIENSENPNIMLGKSPERDREIDDICNMIRNVARAGIPVAKYNLTILGVVRTEQTPGRGRSLYSGFDFNKAKAGFGFGNAGKHDPNVPEPPLTIAGNVSEDDSWERITYFLKRVMPVAEEYKVKLACHPQDPAMPKGYAYRGVHRVIDNPEGLKKFLNITPSPFHGLMFCQGTLSESLQNPAKEILDVIRYFGSRNKIFAVDFRNIKGKFLNFQETSPDDGDVDMLQALRVYREVGYSGMLMPDHAPSIPGDVRERQAFAYALGYIQALVRMVNAEP